jgi:hypothetical protein
MASASGDNLPPKTVKTTVDLPADVWRAAKIRAMDDQADLRTVVVEALRKYLNLPEESKTRRK